MGLLYTPELVGRAEAFLALPTNDKRRPAGLEELAAIWATMQGRPASTCRQCQFSDYQRDVVAYVRESSRSQNSNTVASSYQIAPAFANETFAHEDLATPMTAANITDDAVELLISKGYTSHFVKVSKTAEKPEEGSDLGKLTKPELQAKYKEVVGSDADDKLTKAELTEAIEAAGQTKA